MKKVLSLILCVFILAGALCSCGAASEKSESAYDSAMPAEAPAAPAPESELSRYILRESDGCVAVYRAEDALTPEQVTDIEVALLPASDRARLSVGIGVESRAELLCLLEDLGS